MKIKLQASFSGRKKTIPLDREVMVIGRSHGNAVRIPSSEVSRRHCRLFEQNGLLMVEDLESVNGTFLNGRRLKSAEVVRPGDRVEVGPVAFIVEYTPSAEARKRLQRSAESLEVLDVLEGLADGEAMDVQELPEVELIDEDPLGLQMVEPLDEVQPIPPADDDGPIKPDFDFDAGNWKMPEGGDLRDILSQIEDEQPTLPQPKKRNKK
ncbi:MAG: FHA domain-containing protein [Gemmataceae bacterium]